MPPRTVTISLGALFAFAAFLHVYGVGDKALWYDEVTTALYGSMPVERLVAILSREDFHPPLYFMLQRPFLALPVPVEWQLRLMPLVSWAAAAALAEVIVRRLGGVRWAGAALAAFFPGLLVYAQEARVYATLTALQFAAVYGILRTLEEPKALRWTALTFAALVLTAWMHYLAVLFVVPAGLAALAFSGRRWAAAGIAALAAATYAPWLPVVVRAFFGQSPISHVQLRSVTAADVWSVFHPHWGGEAWAAAVALVSAAALALAWRTKRREAALLTALVVFPWLLLLVVKPKYPFFHPRYFLPWASLPLLLLAWFTPRQLRAGAAAFAAVLVAYFAYAGWGHDRAARVWNRELAAMSAELFEEGDLLVIEPYYQSIALFYYLPLSQKVRENALANPMKVFPTLVVDPNGVPVVATAVDYIPQVVGNAPLSGRVYLLEYGAKSPNLARFAPDMVEVRRWPHATLHRLNKRIWADPQAGHVYIGNRPVARWVPARLEKQF